MRAEVTSHLREQPQIYHQCKTLLQLLRGVPFCAAVEIACRFGRGGGIGGTAPQLSEWAARLGGESCWLVLIPWYVQTGNVSLPFPWRMSWVDGRAPPLDGLARWQLNSSCLIVSERVPGSGDGRCYYFYPGE